MKKLRLNEKCLKEDQLKEGIDHLMERRLNGGMVGGETVEGKNRRRRNGSTRNR